MMPRAQLRSVGVSYGRTRVLSDMTLSLEAGECLALVGPNGSGKSSLLKAVAGLVPSTGLVTLDGCDVRALNRRERARQIAYCRADEPAEWPMSVADSVMMGRSPHRGWIMPMTPDDRTIVAGILEKCGLATLKDRPTDRLSDGERQRVSLARALAQQPKLLLLDEPTANLDLKYQVELLQLVRGWASCGLTVVAAIHDLTLAAGWADRVAMLSQGGLEAFGSPIDVFTAERIGRTYDVGVTVTMIQGRLAIVPGGHAR
jgi:iron complex transport system ATP-binding protein